MAKQSPSRKYGQAAKDAAQLLFTRPETAPRDAWALAVAEIFRDRPASRDKGCPRASFLSLCGFGAIKNVPRGAYTSSKKNKAYMGRALSALLADPSLVEDEDKLWRIATRDKAIAPNGQIEVLTALWQKGFVLNLPSPEQRELIAFLISRQTAEDESFKATLARKIEDTDPANWIELDDLKKRFAE